MAVIPDLRARIIKFQKEIVVFIVIGLLITVFSDLMKYGIGNYPFNDMAIQAVHTVVVWTVVGSVIAWQSERPGTCGRVNG